MQEFESFSQFYPYYLSEHQQPLCRALHYCGSTLVLLILAWVGHFFVEHNKPATFQYPWYSLAADWVMYKDFLTGQLAAKLAQLPKS